MGCDIHWVIEKKIGTMYENEASGWVGVAMKYHTPKLPLSADITAETPIGHEPIYSDRDYRFFAALAGVRGEGPEPRGLPDDISELARIDIDDHGDDGHSHSWATLREFVMTWLSVARPKIYEAITSGVTAARLGDVALHEEVRKALGYYTGVSRLSDIDDYRVVYFFDN